MTPAFDPDAAAMGDGIYGLPHSPEEAEVVLVPVPWAATVSYRPGTADGPAAVLAASRQVDLLDRETGRPYERGIAMLPVPGELRGKSDAARAIAERVIEAGGVEHDPSLAAEAEEVDALCAGMNAWVGGIAGDWLERGKLVGVVGGDHSVPFGLIRAVAERHPGMGILQLDAHADLRHAYEGFVWSHASIMYNVTSRIPQVGRLVQVGIRDYANREEHLIRSDPDHIRTYFDPDLKLRQMGGEPWMRIAREIVGRLPEEVYLSFDVDGLDPGLCPNTGTPVPGGLSFSEAVALVRLVIESERRIVGFDLCETAPGPEGSGEWDANVAARLLYKMIGFAVMGRGA
jgi:agmatinase